MLGLDAILNIGGKLIDKEMIKQAADAWWQMKEKA